MSFGRKPTMESGVMLPSIAQTPEAQRARDALVWESLLTYRHFQDRHGAFDATVLDTVQNGDLRPGVEAELEIRPDDIVRDVQDSNLTALGELSPLVLAEMARSAEVRSRRMAVMPVIGSVGLMEGLAS